MVVLLGIAERYTWVDDIYCMCQNSPAPYENCKTAGVAKTCLGV